MKLHRWLRSLALGAVLLLFVSACGSSADTTEAADGDSPTAEAAPAADNDAESVDEADPGVDGAGTPPAGAASVDDDDDDDDGEGDGDDDDDGDGDGAEEPQTLDDYLGVAAPFVRNAGRGGGAGQALGGIDIDQVIAQQRLIEQEVQVCMRAQGFEYTPEETDGGPRLFAALSGQGLSAEEYAAERGFGISTAFDAILEGDVDFTDEESPNDLHLATLSEGEADAWQFALRGEPPVRNDQGQIIDPDTGEVIRGRGAFASGGCRGDAQVAVRGDFSGLAELSDEFEELNERIDADPRISEIATDWADCMRESGFAYETEAEARAEVNQEFRPLLIGFFRSNAQADGDGAAGGGGGGGGRNLGALLSGLELTDEQELELAALQEREIAIAVASQGCSSDTDDEVAEIRARYEQEFVDENRAVLEQIAR